MGSVDIPDGFGIPLVDLTTDLLPAPTMVAVLDYVSAALPGGDPALSAHIADLTPHPPYDDIPSLKLIFENHLL